MLARLTPAQKFVLGLSLVVLLLGLAMGYGMGINRGTDAEEQVTYTLPDAGGTPITVHVVGAVQRPGLYTLTAGSRVREAIRTAGGLTADADAESVNLAAFVDDGDQVRVQVKPAPETARAPAASTATPQPASRAQPAERIPAPAPRTPRSPSPAASAQPRSDLPEFARRPSQGQVRLNQAGLEELQRIPGVGPELAKKIIYHRSMHGPFRSFSQLDNVPGIGPATIEKIRASATLN